jgi:hypothetical protein
MFQETWGLTSGDPRIEDAIERTLTNNNGRGLSHNATNLAIEVDRYWALRDLNRKPGEPNFIPGTVKAMSAAIVWPMILYLVFRIGRWLFSLGRRSVKVLA